MLDPLSVVIQQEVGMWDCPCCLALVSWTSGPDASASLLEGKSPYHTVAQGQLWPLQSHPSVYRKWRWKKADAWLGGSTSPVDALQAQCSHWTQLPGSPRMARGTVLNPSHPASIEVRKSLSQGHRAVCTATGKC